MICAKSVRDFLQEWRDTGCLPEDKVKAILALEHYRNIEHSCSFLPEHRIIQSNASREVLALERICKARKYIE